MLSLFSPFVTVTSSGDGDEIVALLELGLPSFGGDESGETVGFGVLLVTVLAFLSAFRSIWTHR